MNGGWVGLVGWTRGMESLGQILASCNKPRLARETIDCVPEETDGCLVCRPGEKTLKSRA